MLRAALAGRATTPGTIPSFFLGTTHARRGLMRDLRPVSSIRDHLLADHRRLDRLFDDFLRAASRDAQDEMETLWGELDIRLTAHMNLEDRFLLPDLAVTHPLEAGNLRDDHIRFREHSAKLGEALDLHLVRLDAASAFLDELRAHAEREDALLYHWADSAVDAPSKMALLLSVARDLGAQIRRAAAKRREAAFTD